MTADAGLFAGAGNISIRSAGRTDLTRLSLSGNLEVIATNGAIYLDRDLGGDLVVGTTSTPQPIGSVTLKAGGTDTFERTYYGGPFNGDTGVVTEPNIVRNGTFAVRVRGIKSNGAVTIDGQATTGEILLDGIVDAKGNVSLLAPAIRARHSVFAEGGNITVGGRLILEPWGDEIVVGISNPVTIAKPTTYPTQWTDNQGPEAAPGSLLTVPPAIISVGVGFEDEVPNEGEDVASSQITLRAIRVGGTTGGQIFLTNGAGVEPGTPPEFVPVLAAMRTDQQHVRLDRGASTPNGLVFDNPPVPGDRTKLPLVPLNDIRLNLQADAGVVFRADPATGSFRFSGVPETQGEIRFNNPVGRLTILDATGNPVAGPFTAVGATNPAAPFSGALTSYNDQRGVFDLLPSTDLPGLLLASEGASPSGPPSPPGATSVASGYGIPEVNVGQSGAGSASAGLASGVGGSLALGSARPITDSGGGVTTEPSLQTPPVSPSDEYRRFDLARYETDPLFEEGRGPSRVADLGREAGTRGSAADPFRPYWRVTRSTTSGADPDYFGLSLFDYLERARRRSVP
jgi:hypothetical protein